MLGCRIIVQQVSNFYAKKVLNMSNGYSCTILYVFNVTELQPSNSYGFKVSDFYITCLTTLCIHQQKALKIRFTVRITKQSSESKDRKVRFFNITQNGTYLEIREETEWHPLLFPRSVPWSSQQNDKLVGNSSAKHNYNQLPASCKTTPSATSLTSFEITSMHPHMAPTPEQTNKQTRTSGRLKASL